MMVSLGGTRIVVATRAVDFRKGHDGCARSNAISSAVKSRP